MWIIEEYFDELENQGVSFLSVGYIGLNLGLRIDDNVFSVVRVSVNQIGLSKVHGLDTP